jgi:hypothetical protein
MTHSSTIRRSRLALAASFVVVIAAAGSSGTSTTVPGIRFIIDTAETKAPAMGILSMFAGRIEFAAGRGRIDVSAIAFHPARNLNDVTIGQLLAAPGDYYLFDSTGYILVRPSSRTFSSVSFAASTYRHGNVREAWDGYFEFGPLRREDIAPRDTARLAQHGPFGVRWHLDRLQFTGPAEVLARGRVLVADAPRGEVSVVRWMGVTAALATLRDSTPQRDSDLQLTAVGVLPAQSSASGETNLILLYPMSGIVDTEIDVTRLMLPTGYAETPWPGFERASNLPVRMKDAAQRWLTAPTK